MSRIIVSRHPAAVEFIAQEIGRRTGARCTFFPPGLVQIIGGPAAADAHTLADSIHVVADATQDDVRGRVVYGNLPLHLAALARQVWAVEFHPVPCSMCRGAGELETVYAPPGATAYPAAVLRGDLAGCTTRMERCPECRGTKREPGSGIPPRGAEYTLADMDAAGARLVPYVVLDRTRVEALQQAAHADGYGPDPHELINIGE